MPRPTTKPELVKSANCQFDKIWQLIDSLTDAERNAPFHFGADLAQKEAHWKRDKNLRDVLVLMQGMRERFFPCTFVF